VLAYQTEVFAREKRLRSLKHYLRRPVAGNSQNAAVIDMLKGLAAKGRGVKITQVAPPDRHAMNAG
jgi:hypothetical protein